MEYVADFPLISTLLTDRLIHSQSLNCWVDVYCPRPRALSPEQKRYYQSSMYHDTDSLTVCVCCIEKAQLSTIDPLPPSLTLIVAWNTPAFPSYTLRMDAGKTSKATGPTMHLGHEHVERSRHEMKGWTLHQ